MLLLLPKFLTAELSYCILDSNYLRQDTLKTRKSFQQNVRLQIVRDSSEKNRNILTNVKKHIPDTLSSVKVVVNDSLKYSNDTIDVDTLGEIPLSSNAITNMIKYKAQDSIAMEPNGKHAFIYKKGIIDYQDLKLKADNISVDFDKQILCAQGAPDSAGKIGGKPIFKQGDTEYHAEKIIYHINTQKGKGYVPAEKNPNVFHGISSFDIETGEPVSSGTNFSEQFGLSICDFAANDKRICAITAAMCESTGLSYFAKQYKQRFFDVGIAEQHAVTFAAGLSSNGMIPIFCVYSTFLQRSYDQILHDAALQNLKVIIGIDRAGVVGNDGETHQGIFDVSFLLPIPNVTVYAPVTYEEMRHALKLAIYNTSGVVAIRYPRGSQPELPDEYTSFSDNYDVFGDQNADIAVVTYGRTFKAVINAAERLKNESINIKIIL